MATYTHLLLGLCVCGWVGLWLRLRVKRGSQSEEASFSIDPNEMKLTSCVCHTSSGKVRGRQPTLANWCRILLWAAIKARSMRPALSGMPEQALARSVHGSEGSGN